MSTEKIQEVLAKIFSTKTYKTILKGTISKGLNLLKILLSKDGKAVKMVLDLLTNRCKLNRHIYNIGFGR